MFSRRQVLSGLGGGLGGGLLGAGLVGCASNSVSTSNTTFDLFSHSVSGAPKRAAGEYPMSARQIQDLPYATLGVRVADHPRAVTVLAAVQDGRLQWASADHVIFYTDGGWLTGTSGFSRDLGATRWLAGGDPLAGFARSGTLPPRGVYREIDLRHQNEQAVAVTSRFEFREDEIIDILGVQHPVRRIDEIADMRAWRWQVRNSFWVDAQNGRVWRSRQQYCPEMPPIELEVLKPAAAAAAA